MRRILRERFWQIAAAGFLLLIVAHVAIVGPVRSQAADLLKKLEDASSGLEKFRLRGPTVLNGSWIEAAEEKVSELEGRHGKTAEFFRSRQAPHALRWEKWRESVAGSTVEFKIAYEFESQKLKKLADEVLRTPSVEPFQKHDFAVHPGPDARAGLLQELWVQGSVVTALGRAGIHELVRIRLPRSPSADERACSEFPRLCRPVSSLGEVPFVLECRLSPGSLANVFNELMGSAANVVPESIEVSTEPRRRDGKPVLRLRLGARAFPELL